MKLLIIRPEPGASASAARAREAGYEPLLLPFFEVRSREWQLDVPEKYDALLLTSANAVRHAGAGLHQLPALPTYCVGERTAAAAHDAQLTVAFAGGTDAIEAVQAAIAAGHHKLLWLAGEDHRPIDAQGKVHIDTVIVYASETVLLPDDAQETLESADAVALHSARAAKAFGASVDRFDLNRSKFIVAAFSPAIAAAAGTGWQDIVVAESPADSAMLSALTARSTEQ